MSRVSKSGRRWAPWASVVLGCVAALASSAVARADPQPGLEPAPESFDRSTPRRAMGAFLAAERRGDDATARYGIELSHLSAAEQRARGGELARQLKQVIDRVIWVELDAIPDDPAADAGERVEIADLPLGEVSVPLALESVRDRDGALVWVISGSVVSRVPELYALHGPAWIERMMPPWVGRSRIWEFAAWQLNGLVIALALAVLLGRALAWLVLRVGMRIASRTKASWDDELFRALKGPTRFVLAVIIAWFTIEPLRLAAPAQELTDHVLQMGLIAAVAWMAVRLVYFGGYLLEHRAELSNSGQKDAELRLRGLRTQVLVLRRVISIVIGIVAAALMLTQFEVVRSVGISLLASAGMAGIVIGLAAQRSIATLLAGIQLSITQPIRMGDTVIVEGEWGTIEEINLTYVVVKIWDERRLVVPMTRFLDQPFQNWTKSSSELLGTVFFHADYRLPIDAMRKELARILEGNPLWDGRAKGIVVTDAKDRTIEVRALISAEHAGHQWDLRCQVRERLVAWLRDYEGGKYLPRVRVEEEAAAARVATRASAASH